MNTNIHYDYYFDMDGVLNVFEFGAPKEILFLPGYFLCRPAQQNFVDTLNRMLEMEKAGRPFKIYVLSKFLTDNQWALEEKHKWLNRYTPHLPNDRRIFLSNEENKTQHINSSPQTVIIDDFGDNLIEFKNKGGKIIKVAADAADRRREAKKWPACLSPEQPPEQMISNILAFQNYETLYGKELNWNR